jgi:predicted small secreted protein
MKRLVGALVIACALAGCDNPQRTVDRLHKELADYKASPTDAGQAQIEADLAKLDAQASKLATQGKSNEAATYRAAADNLRADYRAARMVRALKDAQTAIQTMGETIKDAGKSIGDAFRETPSPTPK